MSALRFLLNDIYFLQSWWRDAVFSRWKTGLRVDCVELEGLQDNIKSPVKYKWCVQFSIFSLCSWSHHSMRYKHFIITVP